MTAERATPQLTYRQFLKDTPGPFALYLIDHHTASQPHAVWLIKTTQTVINQLGPQPLIGIRHGLFRSPTALVVVSLIALGPVQHDTLFECWINGYNQSREGLQTIQLLQSQASFLIHIFDEFSTERRALRVDNAFQQFFTECTRHITTHPPWTMAMFDEAKDTICARYPSNHALWEALQI